MRIFYRGHKTSKTSLQFSLVTYSDNIEVRSPERATRLGLNVEAKLWIYFRMINEYSKSRKICRRLKWMVPYNIMNKISYLKQEPRQPRIYGCLASKFFKKLAIQHLQQLYLERGSMSWATKVDVDIRGLFSLHTQQTCPKNILVNTKTSK